MLLLSWSLFVLLFIDVTDDDDGDDVRLTQGDA